MIQSPLCEMLGIKYPVIQGGMAWIADGRLAAAVSNAGGLGLIAAGYEKPEAVREEIRIAKSLTDKPFGLNIMLMSRYVDELAQMAIDEGVRVVTTGAGNPAKYMSMWKEAGIAVIPVVASAALAKLMTRAGATALIAEGGEAGGHIGELSTMVLIPLVCEATNLPVIAAGGIADGRGVAASFMLGACGVQLGTRFLSAEECTIHPDYRDKVLSAKDRTTMVLAKRLGHPVRCLKSPFARDFVKAEYSDTDDDTLESMMKGAYRNAVQNGDAQGVFMAGESAALVHKMQPAAEIVNELMSEAEALLGGANQWVK